MHDKLQPGVNYTNMFTQSFLHMQIPKAQKDTQFISVCMDLYICVIFINILRAIFANI